MSNMSKTNRGLRFWKISGGLAGLLVLLAVLIAANLIVDTMRLRRDLTADKLYTLSGNTRNILQQLEQPVTLKFFFNASAPEIPMPLKYFARQVEDLLREYRMAGGNRILLETYNPEPDSDAEEWAERYGVAAQNMGMMGPPLYLGLVAVRGDAYSTIPFIDPRDEAMLEYNITRMITRVNNPAKPKVGIISSLPVLGVQSFPYAMPGQPQPRNQPPWAAFRGLSDDYEIRDLTAEVEKIPEDLDTLVLVHPKDLSDNAQYAIDQFVLRGGRLLAFVDPLCLADAMNQEQPQQMMGMPPRTASDLGRLTKAWGLDWDDQVLADFNASTRVRQGAGGVEDSPLFLSLRPANFRGDDLLMSRMNSIVMPLAGVFRGAGAAGLKLTPLITSSEQSKTVPAMMAQMGGDMLRRDFQPGMQRLPLAVRLHGNFKTAFPEGKPAVAPADTNAPPADVAPGLLESAQPGTVILVGDVDMLVDQFAVQEVNLFGYSGYQPINDNINFFANALEQLAGAVELAEIRTRGRIERPFDKVLALQQDAQQRWMLQEKALQQQLEVTQERLRSLQSRKEDQNQRYILSPEQEQEIQRFKAEQLRTQQELKQVRKNLREGIERLGVKVKTINILLMPLLVGLAGIIFAWRRQVRAARAAELD